MGTEDLSLLPRMEARPWTNGRTVTYRYHPKGARPVNLGTDYLVAIGKVREWTDDPAPVDALDPDLLAETWSRHRKGAKQRGVLFDISEDDIADVLRLQANRCAVTRLCFSKAKPPGLRVRPWLPSVDRKNCTRGYVRGNIRVVCAFVNVAMNGFGEELFRQVLAPLVDQAVQERLQEMGIPSGNDSFRESTGTRGKTLILKGT